MRQELEKQLQGVLAFMEQAYPLNWQTRWGDVPYMPRLVTLQKFTETLAAEGKQEPITGHVWASMLLWSCLRRICPAVSQITNSEEVYEQLLIHDLGETQKGDTSATSQILFGRKNDAELERNDFFQITEPLPEAIREQFRLWFDNFEGNKNEGELTLPIMIAKWVDTLQGHHFVLTYGSGLEGHRDIIQKIVQKRSVTSTKSIINFLKRRTGQDQGKTNLHQQAIVEVKEVMGFWAKKFAEAGVPIDLTLLES